MSMVPRKIFCLLISLSLFLGTAEGAYARASMTVSPTASHSMDEGMAMDGEMPCCPDCNQNAEVNPGLMSLCQFSCTLVAFWVLDQSVEPGLPQGFPAVSSENGLIDARMEPIPDIPKA